MRLLATPGNIIAHLSHHLVAWCEGNLSNGLCNYKQRREALQSITNKRLTHELSLLCSPQQIGGRSMQKVCVCMGGAEVQLLMNVYVYH